MSDLTELGEHFERCGVGNISLQIIDCVKQDEDEALWMLECYWQTILSTFLVNDGNTNIRKNMWVNTPLFFLISEPDIVL